MDYFRHRLMDYFRHRLKVLMKALVKRNCIGKIQAKRNQKVFATN